MKTDARNNNFDLLRLLGAVMVLWGHTFVLLALTPNSVLAMSVHTMGVKVFFVISGYLITKSWISDPHIWRYALRRALRIMPALIGCVLFTALVIGPIFTSVSAREYFTDRLFCAYFKNIAFHVNYGLPGMFENNPIPRAVNGSLWTLPAEMVAYVLCPVLVYISTRVKFGTWLVCLAVLAFVAFDYTARAWPADRISQYIFYATNWVYAGQLLSYFWIGMIVVLLNLERFFTLRTALVLVVLTALVPLSGYKVFLPAFVIIPLVTLAFALSPRLTAFDPLLSRGDISYGLYLYAFPVQQVVNQIAYPIGLIEHFLISLTLTTLLAILSWKFVESPALKYKPVKSVRAERADTARSTKAS